MKIGVMGCMGVVGQAVVKVFIKAHEIYGFDPVLLPIGGAVDPRWMSLPISHRDTYADWVEVDESSAMTCQAIFICAPTPWDDQKKEFGAGPVEKCVQRLCEAGFSGLIILKSTTLPCVAHALLYKIWNWTGEAGWETASKPRLVACPEFLNARTAYEDLRDARHIIIGGPKEDRDLCLEIHKQAQPGIQGYFLDLAAEAMMLKYMQNTYFATKNALFNQFAQVCKSLGLDYQAIRSGIVLDDRVHPVHTDVPGYDGMPGYGGMCLPKDIRAFQTMVGKEFEDLSIFELVDRYNTKLREG